MKDTVLGIIGILGVVCFMISYLQRTRGKILAFNILARIFCIIQYLMLSLFDGAILNLVGVVSTVLAQKKKHPFVEKYFRAIILIVNILIVTVGIISYKNYLTIFSIIGMMTHISAMWINDEKKIRTLTMVGFPFCLIYDIAGGAYASVACDVVGISALVVAILRYDVFAKKKRMRE